MAPPTGALPGGTGTLPGGTGTLPGGTGALPQGGTAQQGGFGAARGGFGGPGGGGMFGGDSQSLTEALAYVTQNGGGTLAVSSQSGAASQLIRSGADVAAIGGFSGRESQVSVAWLAQAVEDGRIRWVLTDGGNGMPQDGRIGSTEVMAAAAKVGTSTSVDGLYDLRGHADELRALAG
jgi:hypothetical protein